MQSASHPSTSVIVGEVPSGDDAAIGKPFSHGGWFASMMKAAKLQTDRFHIINSIGCHTPNNIHPLDSEWTFTPKSQGSQATEYCRQHHLLPNIEKVGPKEIITLGDRATNALTGRSPITLWRGSALPMVGQESRGLIVKPTISPESLGRQSSLFPVVVRDLQRPLSLPPENYNLSPTLDDLQRWCDNGDSTVFSFDFEWDSWGAISLCGLSNRLFEAIVVPFTGEFMGQLKQIFENATQLIGQNIIGADLTHLAKLGWKLRPDVMLWDTMLMQHLTQPDYRHGLAFIASVTTFKNFWKGSDTEDEDSGNNDSINGAQWKTWDKAGALSIAHGGYGGCNSAKEAYALYNARDTDATWQAWHRLKEELRRFDLEHVYWNVSLPAAKLCQQMSSKGLKLDHTKLKNLQDTLDTQIAEAELLLPAELAPYDQPIMVNSPAPPNTYKPKQKKYKGQIYIFTKPDTKIVTSDGKVLEAGKMTKLKIIKTPSTKRIRPYNSDQTILEWVAGYGAKEVLHRKTKNPTSDKNARRAWQQQFAEIKPEVAKVLGVVSELKRLSTQRQSFAKQGFLQINRVYYNILPHGTAEGRFSSSGQRKGLDPNIQNQPKIIRKLFVPDSKDHCFLSVDISQGENELTALLSKDYHRMKMLRTEGYDEHAETASIALELNVVKGGENGYLRQAGKKINHMTNYGAGAKLVQAELALEGFPYTLAQVKTMLLRLALGRPALTAWQKDVIAFVEANKFATNPFGRKRWFQDSRFATKAMAFGPASTLADVVIRMMIACHASEFQREIGQLDIGVCGDLPEGWDLRIQVHDELCFHGPIATIDKAAQLVGAVMTQPWKALDGFAFNIDMQASKVSWGDLKPYVIGQELI